MGRLVATLGSQGEHQAFAELGKKKPLLSQDAFFFFSLQAICFHEHTNVQQFPPVIRQCEP